MTIGTNEVVGYDELLNQLRWTHALLAILVEYQGGLVEITQEVVESYPLDQQIQVALHPDKLTYTIEVIPAGEVVSDEVN